VLGAIAVASDIAEFRLVGDLIRLPSRVTESTVTATDQRQTVIAFIQLAGTLVAGGLFIIWTRRAYRNLWGLGTRGMRFRPGWAVGSWLVPIINLFRPKQIVDDIHRASDPALPVGSMSWRGSPVPALFHVWWALWVVGGVIGTWAGLQPQPTSLGEYRALTGVLAVLDAMQALAAIFAAWSVEVVTRRQEERALTVLSLKPTRRASPLAAGVRYGFVAVLGLSIFLAATLALR
ncbi:DUF4328 domain-containing protein, partial [bacterium]|nr:DUF4328 domain-containing protein [bacterium]